MSIKTFDVISLGKANLMNPEQLGYQDSLGIIHDELHRTKRSFVKIGWYLKHILKNEMYKEDGYTNIYELASDKFNLSQATATRFMQICEQFSIGHDSPELDEKYIDFNMSQLFEMLPMNQEDMEKVTPSMKVSDIRKFKKESKELSEKKSDEDNIPGQTSIEKDFREFMPDSNQNNADDDVPNGESNVYAISHKENDSCSVDLMDKDKIIDGEYREIKAPETEEEIAMSQSDKDREGEQEESLSPYGLIKTVNPVPLPEDGIELTRYILEQEKKNLDDILKVDKVKKLPEMMVIRQKTIVGALAAMVCDLEEEQGFLLKLPCKVGDTVYFISEKVEKGRRKITTGIVDNITLGNTMIPQITVCDDENIWTTFDIEDFGKNVFLTQPEAEDALKKRQVE